MTLSSAFRMSDPVDLAQLERMSSSSASEDLRLRILSSDLSESADWHKNTPVVRLSSPHNQRRTAALTVAAVVVVVASVVAIGGTSHSPKASRSVAVKAGTWKFVDDVLNGTWQEYKTGPPPGLLDCPTASECYTMSGQHDSPALGSPLLSESLYVSTNGGATWTGSPMPEGFDPTSPLACGGPSDCAAGGTDNGQSVLASTSDGGHAWELAPLPQGVGMLETLSCPSTDVCAGLAADSELQLGTTNATFLSTSDGGKSFTDKAIVAGDSMQSLACSSSLDCTAIGWNNTFGPSDLTAGVAATTTDGGQTWTPGTLPGGLGVNYLSQLSCADALHCTMTGTIAITVESPTTCSTAVGPGQGTTSLPTPTTLQSPAVKAIAQAAGQAASEQEESDAASGTQVYPCGAPSQILDVGALASTTDGGLSWTPDPLPSGTPEPMLSGLSCPSDDECWATGTDAIPLKLGAFSSSNQPLVLGTTNGGSSWSKVTFSAPQGVPNDLAANYVQIGWISCPSPGSCVALGTGVQSTSSVPAYSLQAAEQSS